MTSLLDASSIYGSTAEEQHELRLMFKVENLITIIIVYMRWFQGKLKYTALHIRKPLLPPLEANHAAEMCRISTPNLHCFHAGDGRSVKMMMTLFDDLSIFCYTE